jgi:hypothetical protein
MEQKLTIIESYKAMLLFLEGYYLRMGKPDSLGILLSGFQFINDDQTVDPAALSDWNDAVNKILLEKQS